jgi:putative ABC transport system permease protein
VKIAPLFQENFRISLRSIRTNLLRTVLTILIIAFGIMSLVGILTAIDSIKDSINSEFTNMGANTFKIQNRGMRIHVGGRNSRPVDYKAITYREAIDFKEKFSFPALISISMIASRTSTVKFMSQKTNPNITIFGADENYLATGGYEIRSGRNFSTQDIQFSRNYILIGSKLVEELFAANQDPIGSVVSVGSTKYKIIGVLEEKGSSMGGAGDKICIIPVSNARQSFGRADLSFIINIKPIDGKFLDFAISESEGLFRQVRRLKIADQTNFEIIKSDSLVLMLLDNIKYVTIAATLIGVITLLGAAIGLMNIMLVSVTERTREIGTRKALGATSSIIKQQFLFESVVIGQLGGLLGIILGILIGNLISLITGGAFIVPWLWIIGGVVLCFFVGLLSGLIPAIKASRLDPIIALRYE